MQIVIKKITIKEQNELHFAVRRRRQKTADRWVAPSNPNHQPREA
jgi:hypothetical protein